jgi:hypothetical protein
MKRKPRKKNSRPSTKRKSHSRTQQPARNEPKRLPITTNKVEEESLNRGVSAELIEGSSQDSRKATQAGDLTGVSGDQFSAGETTAELMREGQGLEGEEVQAVEDAPDADEREVSVRRRSRARIPAYKNRSRL